MIYITGDKHGRLKPVKRFARANGLTAEDVIVILGDAGFNYFDNEKDAWTKKTVAGIAATVFFPPIGRFPQRSSTNIATNNATNNLPTNVRWRT